MNITNHIKELKFRIYYLIFSFIFCFTICILKKETLIYINFWYCLKETPIYYSGIFEYYFTILELSLKFCTIIIIYNLIYHIYQFFKPVLYNFQVKLFKIKILIYIFFTISISFLVYFILFPLFYSDFSINNYIIEFLPNITLILKLQSSILLINNILLLIIFKLNFFNIKFLYFERKLTQIFILLFSAIITPPGFIFTIILSLFLFIIVELYFLFKFFKFFLIN